MKKTYRLIGDVHGKFSRYKKILDESPYPTIQVGDMGVGFRHTSDGVNHNAGDFSTNPPYDKMVEGGHRFIRGNHDNPAVCKRHSQYINDGDYEDGTMFIGGALSIDKAYRHEGFSYWPDEEIDTLGLNDLVDHYVTLKPRVMITHECPEEVAEQIVDHDRASMNRKAYPTKLDPAYASRTRQAFQSMWSAHSPEEWYFGHWHVPFDHVLRGTRFVCLPELATIDVELGLNDV